MTLSWSTHSLPVLADDPDPIRVAPKRLKPSEIRVGELFGPLKGNAIDGRVFDLESARDHKATVVALTSTSCPICKKYAATLAEIEKKFADQGVRFCYVNPLPSDELDDIRLAIKDHGFKGPYIHDKNDQFTKAFQIRTTAEVFVFDSARTLVYRGAVDDQYGLGYSLDQPRKTYLEDALDAMLAGQPVKIAATSAPGCDLWQPGLKKTPGSSKVTYHNRVSRIVQNHCVECHRDKGLAPFSLETAEDMISHAGMIQTVVKNGTMPPWFAKEKDPSKWSNDRSLDPSQKSDLLNWLSSERPLGDPKDAPVQREHVSRWNIGTPDKIFQLRRPFSIKSRGTMPYQYAQVETGFKQDQWISAVEIRPTNRAVVHHVLVFLAGRSDRGNLRGTDGFFAAYVPGNSYQVFPEGFAKKIPAGSKMVFQIHYTPVGKATRDQTQIAFKFYQGQPKHAIRVKGIANRRIRIPAGAENHPEKATLRLPTDVKLLAFMPHMHLRGKAFRYDFIDRTSGKQTILDIPRYDFNWQLVYRLAEPISARQGSRIEATGWFDNSDNNPANPDPTQTVRWGDQTHEEMMLGYVEYYLPDEVISTNRQPAETGKQPNRARPENRSAQISRAIASGAFERYDKNGDGKVTRSELGRPTIFETLNRNGDDHLTLEEILSRDK